MDAVCALTVMPRSRSTWRVSVFWGLAFFSAAVMFPKRGGREGGREGLSGG